MLKRFTAILLLAAFISCNWSLFLVYAGFELNHKYIQENLCINKGRPWLHCNGQCYFMKKIQQAADNEKKQENRDNLNKMEVSLFQEPFKIAFIEPTIIIIAKDRLPAYCYPHSNSYLNIIFRPPKQAV